MSPPHSQIEVDTMQRLGRMARVVSEELPKLTALLERIAVALERPVVVAARRPDG